MPPLSIIRSRAIIRRLISRIRAGRSAPSKIMAVLKKAVVLQICLFIVKKIPEHLLFREEVLFRLRSTAQRNSTLRRKQKNEQRNKVDKKLFHVKFCTFSVYERLKYHSFSVLSSAGINFFISPLDNGKNHGILKSVLR